MTSDNKQELLWESLKDADYRHGFVEEEINVGLAFQIRSLRNRQNLTQGDLAKKLQVKQPLVSSWENPGYGKYSIKTLKELAKAFDVGLLVKFVPFSSLVDINTKLTSDDIAPANFGEEERSIVRTPSSPNQIGYPIDANNYLGAINALVPDTFSSTRGVAVA
jgi:transcriptional regulator with XRE-family HTH domain